MGLNLKTGFFTQVLVLVTVVLVAIGCASIQRPMGGPRDHTPPKLLLATPLDQTRNFKATQIKLDFDEYFKLTNQYQEITISPAMDKQPEYKIKKKSLIINFKDTLQKNTTYVINFGKAIVDVNEGNVLKNFTYVFSTGPHIDSLSISGTVFNIQTQQKEKDATVMLFPLKQDSILFGKKKPAIYATTDTSGNFSLANLHEGDYKIYALKETAPDKIYNHDDELIAFQKRPIHLIRDTSNINMTLFRQAPENFRAVGKFDPDGSMFFTFNMPVNDPDVHINFPEGLNDQKIVDFARTKDTARIYMRNMDFDSISVSFTDKGKILDTVALKKQRKENFQRTINVAYNLSNDNKLKPGTDLMLTLNSPIDSYDISRIILLEDSVNRTNYTLTKDPDDPKKFSLKYRWHQGSRYQLALNDGSFTNIYGDKNKRQTRNFTVDKPENYGTVGIKLSLPDSSGKSSYIIELLNDQKKVIHSDVVKRPGPLVYKDYPAGKYGIRVIYDTNNNGKWDSGNIKRKIYPEQIYLFPIVLTVRPNWEDTDNAVQVPKETVSP